MKLWAWPRRLAAGGLIANGCAAPALDLDMINASVETNFVGLLTICHDANDAA